MNNYGWNLQFLDLHQRCVAHFESGNQDFNTYYTPADQAFLKSIGYQPREFFDFIEDHSPDLSASTALLIAGVRRAYFLMVQKGVPSQQVIAPASLPPKPAEMAGIPWLPRLIAKAKAKLRGELHPDSMYGCGGDRMFFQKFDIAPADFLLAVWHAQGDDQAVLSYVQAHQK
jgi:hypothetical protein